MKDLPRKVSQELVLKVYAFVLEDGAVKVIAVPRRGEHSDAAISFLPQMCTSLEAGRFAVKERACRR